jgi:hypothetical protein
MAWPRDSRSEDTPLSESTCTELCFPGGDAQRLLRIDEEAPLKDQKIALLEQRVANLEKENDLLKQYE